MTLLIAGLALWVLAHMFPVLMVEARANLVAKLGKGPYRGLFSLLILASLAMIIFGWRATIPEFLYIPSPGLRHPAMLLVTIAFIFFAVSHFPNTRLRRWIPHPQLTAVLVWAIAHLLANGENRSIALFGTMAVWSLLSIILISKRDGKADAPATPMPLFKEVLMVVIGVVIAGLVVKFHQYIAGIALITPST